MQTRSRVIKPSRLRERRKKLRQIKMGLAAFLLVVIFFGIVWLSRLQQIRLTNVITFGNNVVLADDLKSVAINDMSGYYWHLFPKNNAFIYPAGKIEHDILAAFPRIKSVSVAFETTETLRIEVVERQPLALWCQPVQNGSDQCYFIDDQGYIFAEAPDFEGDVFTKYYGLVSTDTPIGSRFLDTDRLANLQTFVSAVAKMGLPPTELHATSTAEYELDLDGGGKILFTDNHPLTEVLSNLDTVLGSLPLGSKTLHFLEYVDLRFNNKVFYKTSTTTKSSSL